MSEKLPSGWQLGSLEQIAKSSGGGTPSKDDASFWVGGAIPWVSPKDMKSFVIAGSEDTVTELALDRLTLIPEESVLVVVRSGILSRTLPVAITSVPVTVNQDMRAFTPEAGVSAKYAAWQLVANEHELLNACSKHGTTVASMEGPALSRFPLLIAPSAEQKRIVAKLEELLSDLDAGVAELKAAQKKLAKYRQSLLKVAVEGALTQAWRTQNPPTETGAQLLHRILQERRARWEGKQLAKFESQGKAPNKDWQMKYPEPVPTDTSGLQTLPRGWVWGSLDALIADGPQNGVYLPGDLYGSGTPILRIDDYQIGWHRSRATLNLVNADKATCQTYALAPGDLVINRVNSMTHLGKSLLVTELLSGVLFESNMMRSGLSALVFGEFIAYYLGSDIGRARLTQDAKWAVNQASINQQDVRRTPVPIAPLSEQRTIAAILKDHLDAADQQRIAIDQSLKQSKAQRKNILRAAFSGQLVPQDPSDEPANVLLERIRAERIANQAASKPRGRKFKEPA